MAVKFKLNINVYIHWFTILNKIQNNQYRRDIKKKYKS